MMNVIVKKMDEFNTSFIMEIFPNNRMEIFDTNALQKLSHLQQYELSLNQSNFGLNSYTDIDISIINWPKIEEFNITQYELMTYIEDRLQSILSLDRIYFFHELLFNSCQQKQKKLYATKLVASLKDVIQIKLDSKSEKELLLRLFVRFIIMSERYKLIDEGLITQFNQTYLKKFNIEQEYYISIFFFQYIFKKYKKNMVYYQTFLEFFSQFTNIIDKEVLNNKYQPYRKYAAEIAIIYEIINDYDKKIYFYQKEIDNTILYCQNNTINNAMNNQSLLKKNMIFADKIKYKLKILKDLSKRNALYISENYGRFFHSIANKEIEIAFFENLKNIKQEYNKIKSKEEMLDYILFWIFHTSYYSTQYELYKKNNKDDGILSLFSSTTLTDHMGYSHPVVDQDTFSFFNHMSSVNNDLFIFLDNEVKWIKLSKDILLKEVEKLALIDDMQLQYKSVINFFYKEQYIEFMYITPTLIEAILKRYLSQINGDILSFRKTSVVDKTMNQIIEQLIQDENCYLDKYILRYVSFILVENTGRNLRNNILHGNYADGYFNKNNAMYLYIILVYLIRYFVNDQD